MAEGTQQGESSRSADQAKKPPNSLGPQLGSRITSLGDVMGFLAVVTRWEVRRYVALRDVV